MVSDRAVKVWAWIAAAHEGDAPVSMAAVCRAAARRLGVDGVSVTAVSGLLAREPVFASDELSRAAGGTAVHYRGRSVQRRSSGWVHRS